MNGTKISNIESLFFLLFLQHKWSSRRHRKSRRISENEQLPASSEEPAAEQNEKHSVEAKANHHDTEKDHSSFREEAKSLTNLNKEAETIDENITVLLST